MVLRAGAGFDPSNLGVVCDLFSSHGLAISICLIEGILSEVIEHS
jgi:hypothetical protein